MSVDSTVDTDEGEGEHEFEEEYPFGKYLGERNVNGERHGKGWAILPNGDQYDGDYRRGQRHGVGLYVFKNGARYLGRYRCGMKNDYLLKNLKTSIPSLGLKSGQGVFYYPDGSIYEGAWRKDLKHGYGVYTYPNGDIYKGNWYKNRRHGVGVYIYKDEDVCFKGTWKNGVRVGPAEIHFKGFKYHGYWDYLYPQGPGMFTFDCKYMLSGYYQSYMKIEVEGEENLEEEGVQLGKINEMNEEGEEHIEEEAEDIWALKQRVPPSIWYAQEMYKYDYSKLPQHPIPLPIPDSEESICDLSVEEAEKVSVPYKGEEEEEMEQEEHHYESGKGKEEEDIDLPDQDIWAKCPP